MSATMKFNGTGNELCGRLIVGILLCIVTLGIYMPWFLVGLTKYIVNSTSVKSADKGDLIVDFTGTGGEFFVNVLIAQILVGITFGIYLPWALVSFTKLCLARTTVTAGDGAVYTGTFNATGGDTFGKMIVGFLLTAVTFGIYGPWFHCAFTKHCLKATTIHENGQAIGNLDFVGQGGPLFKETLVGVLLTVITLGIYGAWFAVTLTRFYTINTKLTLRDTTYTGAFNGTGNTYFGITFLGAILSSLTLGIYLAWELASILKFHIDNTEVIADGVTSTPALVHA